MKELFTNFIGLQFCFVGLILVCWLVFEWKARKG